MKLSIKDVPQEKIDTEVNLEVQVAGRELERIAKAIDDCPGWPKVTITLVTNRRYNDKSVHIELRNWTPSHSNFQRFDY
jgi:hypothetical protein